MLIFGYGPRKPKDLGPTAPARCPSCGNEVAFHLLQQRRWVSLFFVPVIPTSADHALVCPLCQHTVALDAHQGRLALGLASATADHRDGRLDDTSYRAQVDAFWQAVGGRRDTDETAGPGTAGRDPWDTGTGPWTAGGPSGGPGSTSSPGPTGGATGPVFGAAGPGPGEPHQPTHPAASGRPTDTGGAPPPDPVSRRPDPDPGWYPDPFGEADERYWDGGRWTQGTKPPQP